MEEQTTTLGKKAFADLIGRSPSYVTKLKNDGRLVMTSDGKKVNVAASQRLIEQTAGIRGDVTDRWQAARNARTDGNASLATPEPEKTPQRPTAQADAAEKIGSSLQAARAVKEKYAALTAKAEYETLIGNLIPREDVDAVLRFVGATVRSLMDVYPDQNAPVLCAVSDIHEVHAHLTDACREVLAQLGAAIDRQKQTIAKE